MANSILMFLLPPPNAQVAAQLMRHCLSLLLTQQMSQQSIGMSGVLFLLRPMAPWRKVGHYRAAVHSMLLYFLAAGHHHGQDAAAWSSLVPGNLPQVCSIDTQCFAVC